MALIKCGECGKEISTTAENCPYCGFRTAHGRSVTNAKVLLVSLTVFFVLTLVGVVMFSGNVGPIAELLDDWEHAKSAYGWRFHGSFFSYVSYCEQEDVLSRFVFGLCLMIGGCVGLIAIAKKKDRMTVGNGFELEKNSPEKGTAVFDAERIPAWMRVQMEKEAKENEEQ